MTSAAAEEQLRRLIDLYAERLKRAHADISAAQTQHEVFKAKAIADQNALMKENHDLRVELRTLRGRIHGLEDLLALRHRTDRPPSSEDNERKLDL